MTFSLERKSDFNPVDTSYNWCLNFLVLGVRPFATDLRSGDGKLVLFFIVKYLYLGKAVNKAMK